MVYAGEAKICQLKSCFVDLSLVQYNCLVNIPSDLPIDSLILERRETSRIFTYLLMKQLLMLVFILGAFNKPRYIRN